MNRWNGFQMDRFTFEGMDAIVVFPIEGTSNGRLMLKTEYWDAFPDAVEIPLLHKGFHLCYLANVHRWGGEDDLDRKARFVRYLCLKYHLSEKTVPVGMSCGGLMAIKFAAKYPELVSCLYLDAPVLNYMSCPCGFGIGDPLFGPGTDGGVKEILRSLNMHSISELICYRKMPLDYIPKLIEDRLPVVMVAGGSDRVVPFAENGYMLQKAYEEASRDILVVIKENCGHHPHGLEKPQRVLEFILSH